MTSTGSLRLSRRRREDFFLGGSVVGDVVGRGESEFGVSMSVDGYLQSVRIKEPDRKASAL